MKVVIEICPEHYYPFLSACEISSTEHTILKNAIIACSWARRTIEIVCDENEAAHLLDTAYRLYPEAARSILTGINLARRLREGSPHEGHDRTAPRGIRSVAE